MDERKDLGRGNQRECIRWGLMKVRGKREREKGRLEGGVGEELRGLSVQKGSQEPALKPTA